ncbi:hypothetical protein JDV09_24580 [Mycobacterium sp. Y57]|uniref:hypothetical protein n=1 Tax=Mycolicibacterium xanthum TaxID=2796469 RepID=UPI001C851EF5|nr:hypothetical protein [Mycolicibacterium xanthum]MBX7435250.1 hypothetical protein [Mycolicibacterium xanthum]
MATVAEKFSSVGTKFQVGAATAALATAAALTPAVAANADVAVPMPSAPAITDIAAAPVLGSIGYAENAGWLWVGPSRPDAPPKTTFLSFKPLVLVPDFFKPFFGWTAGLNFQVCAFGLTVAVNAYAEFTASVARGC